MYTFKPGTNLQRSISDNILHIKHSHKKFNYQFQIIATENECKYTLPY